MKNNMIPLRKGKSLFATIYPTGTVKISAAAIPNIVLNTEIFIPLKKLVPVIIYSYALKIGFLGNITK
jgi:hypothetical protein